MVESKSLLAGKVAIVTGGGRGIGRALVLALADHGAKVVVNDLGGAIDGVGASQEPASEVVEEIRRLGGQAVSNFESVASFEGGERIVRTALDSFGDLDIVVTPAGILRDRMIFNMTEEEWDAVVAVHLKGQFNVMRHAAVHMRQQRKGRLITFTSVSGLFGNSGQANYGAAKEAAAGFTRAAARELGRYGITVNCVSPQASTRMGAATPEATAEARTRVGLAGVYGMPPPADVPRVPTDPEAIAAMVVWLASDESANVNGQVFHVTANLVVHIPDYSVARRITKPEGRWTLEEIAAIFNSTLGMGLRNPAPPSPSEPQPQPGTRAAPAMQET